MPGIKERQVDDEGFTSEQELDAEYKQFLVHPDFPVSVTSVDSSTKTITISGTDLKNIQVTPGDTVEITSGDASGDYTVNTVPASNQLTVEESIPDASSGNLNVYHPPGSNRVGTDDRNWGNISGTILQDVLDSIDTQIAGNLTANEHANLNQLVHHLAEDSYGETLYNGEFVDKHIIWQTSNKNTKVREWNYTWSDRVLEEVSVTQYDGTGTAIKTVTRTYTRGPRGRVTSHTDTVS